MLFNQPPICAWWHSRFLNTARVLRRVPDDCTYEEAQLVRDCLQNEPDERPSAKDLVNRLAGSTARSARLAARGSGGSLTGGHISGQLLADGRCAVTVLGPEGLAIPEDWNTIQDL
jgi:hypothetical protein